jgi:hypothetical protein
MGKCGKEEKASHLVIHDHDQRIAILTQAHEGLGHRGEQSVFETIR